MREIMIIIGGMIATTIMKITIRGMVIMIKEQNFGFFGRNIAETLVIGGPQNNIANRWSVGQKNRKNRQNIENSRYFGEISRLYLMRACAGISGKISIKYR